MNNFIDICDELHQNFIDFAHEVNTQRAFPDARDGLKPGQRACLWEMYSNNYTSNKPHVKSAKISGGTAAMWWPHGTTAIYETFGRMSMPWVNNIPEVDWHGNNGNVVIGQALAADRYTEARLAKIVEEGMFQGINKNNVPMNLNFSEDAEWPEVLPAVFPRLLVNGSQGIGSTIANVWVPMNFKECGNVIINYLKTGEINLDEPLIDFPSGGIIINKDELPLIHKTGKGKVILRGKCEIVKNTIQITELPYQVYVEPFLNKIKEDIDNGKITLIKNIYNKTDKKRLLIEIECTSSPEFVLNYLYENTGLQETYSANQWALIGKTPQLLNLSDYIKVYTSHNIECIKKEYEFDLKKAQDRQEIVNGLLKALEDIDNVIEIIKKSSSSTDAINNLMKKYSLSEVQSKAIVDMKLGRLANLERIELQKESEELNNKVKEFNSILSSDVKQKEILIERLSSLILKYGTERKTELCNIKIVKTKKVKEKPIVEPEKVVVILTEDGAVKRIPATSFRAQNRNSKGVRSTSDIVRSIIRTNTVDALLVFTNFGKVYRLPVSDLPVGTNSSKGTLINLLIKMEQGEKPCLIYSVAEDTKYNHILFSTEFGVVKRTKLEDFNSIRKNNGTAAIKLKEGDKLASVSLMNDEDIILLTEQGMAIRFPSKQVSVLGRTAAGVKGINLKDGDRVVSAIPIRETTDSLGIFNRCGVGKKIVLSDIGSQSRGGKGLKVSPSPDVIGGTMLSDEDIILISGSPNSICINAKDVATASRIAKGNIMIKNGTISSVSKI